MPTDRDPAFLLELAHYEWVELALQVSDAHLPTTPWSGRLDALLQISPLAWLLAYQWPVHTLQKNHQPQVPPQEPTLLLVYRNAQHFVKFTAVNPLTAHLIERVRAHPNDSVEAHLRELAQAVQHPNISQFLGQGQSLLQDLCARDVIFEAI